MKKIGELLTTEKLTYSEPFMSYEEHDQRTAKIINKLFLTFTHIFPAFKQAWPTESEFEGAKREWVKAFQQAGVSDLDAIKSGVAKYRLLENPFVPSPGQFIAMCKKEFKPACHQDYIPLPKPPTKREVVLENLAKMKALLK